MSSDHKYIESLIKRGENQQLDFKFEISDSKKIARTLSAFSNTDGGTLLIGVKDNGTIKGINSAEEYHMLEAAAQFYCRPQLDFKAKEWSINGKKILEVTIPPDLYIPYKAPDHNGNYKAYIRVKDQNLLANSVLLEVWRWKKLNSQINLKYDEKVEILFQYLKTYGNITINTFCKIATINKMTAKNTLVKLILLKQIDLKITENDTFYFLRQ